MSLEPPELWRDDCAQCVKPLQCLGCADGHRAALGPSKHQENHICSHFFAPSASCRGFAADKAWGKDIHPRAWESCSRETSPPRFKCSCRRAAPRGLTELSFSWYHPPGFGVCFLLKPDTALVVILICPGLHVLPEAGSWCSWILARVSLLLESRAELSL